MGRKTAILSLALSLALALSSCAASPAPVPEPEPGPEPENVDVTDVQEPEPEGYSMADSVFSINYDPGSSLNPLIGTNVYNEQLFGLLYEGLFALTPNLEAVPVLCADWETQDGQTWFFTLKDGVTFHDGTPLTSADVTYTLTIAKGSDKYSERLSDLDFVGSTDDGRVEVRLRRANYLLPKLLDVPIIKTGTADDSSPTGTGPYRMGTGRLSAYAGHRDYTADSLRYIYLRQTPEASLAEAFSERSIDLLARDPTGVSTLNIHMVHESRYYDTTSLVYLAFNRRRSVTGDQLVRRAMLRLVDREGIVSEVFGSSVVSSPFILSPVLELYNEEDAAPYGLSRSEFERLSYIADLADTNMDGFLEWAGDEFELRFIVNSESPLKVSAARRITDNLRNAGFNVTLDTLTFSQYTAALSAGDFDLYLAEAHLRADMDITDLVSGGLNYGKINDPEYTRLMDAYLAAPEGEARVSAARELDLYVAEDVSIIPLCYKRFAVFTHVGVVSGAEPSQSGLYRDVLKWTVRPG